MNRSIDVQHASMIHAESNQPDATPAIEIASTLVIASEYEVAGNVEDLMMFAANVVVGQYDEFVEERNMGEQFYSEVYTFKVEHAMKGTLMDTIKVAIPRNRIKTIEYEGQNYEVNLDLPEYSKPEPDRTIVLFLGNEKEGGIYTPSSLPFQIAFSSDGVAELLWRKAEYENEQLLQTKNKQTIKVVTEKYDLEAIDEISGINKETQLSALSQK